MRTLPLLGVAAAFLGFRIVLITFYSGGARVIAGLATIAAWLGITWRSSASGPDQLAERLEEPIWGEELDAVIGDRMTFEFPSK